jgi:hypothetical protein
VEQIDCEKLLKDENPRATEIKIKIFAAALLTYLEASENVAKNGAICSHPRTGAPFENPYLKVRAAQGAIIAKMSDIKSSATLRQIEALKAGA